jgi:hypothetical protein
VEAAVPARRRALGRLDLERSKIQAALRDIVGPAPPAEVRIGGRSAELVDRARVAA